MLKDATEIRVVVFVEEHRGQKGYREFLKLGAAFHNIVYGSTWPFHIIGVATLGMREFKASEILELCVGRHYKQ
jgi:hypothetical protein